MPTDGRHRGEGEDGTGHHVRGEFAAECIVVHPAGEEPSAELKAALSRHGVRFLRARNSFDAMAELCRRGREQAGQPALILLLAHPERVHEAAGLYRAAQKYVPRASCWVFHPDSTPRLRAATPEDAEHWSPSGIERLVARPTPSGSMRAAAHGVPNRVTASSDASVRRHAAEPVLRLTSEVKVPDAGQKSGAAQSLLSLESQAAPAPVVARQDGQAEMKLPPNRGQNGATRQILTDEELAMLLDERPSL